jgi:undecaprenyl diphosphate synthase
MTSYLPNHVAFIPDGNRRWAREHKLPTIEGHRRGFEQTRKIADFLRKRGVHTFTVWAFSTENWKRDPSEVKYLMNVYEVWIRKFTTDAIKDKSRIIHIGRKDRIPASLLRVITTAEEKTKLFDNHQFGIALDYGGRDEVIRAISRLEKSKAQLKTEEDFSLFLDTKDFKYPSPDLVIRTSGELRTSGFMIWQAAYAEYIFVKKFLPDFTNDDMKDCLTEFEKRLRRFGK